MSETKRYFGLFEGEGVDCLWGGDLLDSEVIFAEYEIEDYSGSASCVYVRDGKVFEVHDSHCSCNGLENWEPEETSFEAILMRHMAPELLALVKSARAKHGEGERG